MAWPFPPPPSGPLAGGGAYFFSPDVRKKYGIDIPKRPEFANVEGFFEILQEMKQNT